MRRITVAGVRRRLARYRGIAKGAMVTFLQDGTLPGRDESRAAVDFGAWLRRGAGRKASGHPDSWRVDPQLPLDEPSRVAVLVHVFYPELLPELLGKLEAMPVEFDLVVTNSSGRSLDLGTFAAPMLRNTVSFDTENRGRDIFPLVQVVNAGILDPYEVVLKVHTKKSAWRTDRTDLDGSGDAWRAGFVEELVGNGERIRAILGAFADHPNLGLVTAAGNVMGPEHWGADEPLTRELLRRLELDVVHDDLQFAAGSMYWVKAFVLQGLRALNLTAVDFEDERAAHIDGTTAHAMERSIGILTREAGLTIEDTGRLPEHPAADGAWKRFALSSPRKPAARFVPFYLPQFHPTAENDLWWGKGFTEWTNVTAARPVYRGQHQPRFPTELGFYDLRLDAVREQQRELATEHDIAGFMYYHYWFAGRQLLELPVNKLVASDVEQPFCLMWANENWTRRWDGRSSDILIGQDYDEVPAEGFIDDVAPLLSDRRYLRVNGKAVLAIYRPGQIPDFPTVAANWRERARAAGIGELFLLSVSVAEEFDGLTSHPSEYGLDGTLGFPPHNLSWVAGPSERLSLDPAFRGNLMSYGALVTEAIKKLRTMPDDFYPGVMVTFDNTARRQWRPDIWYGSNPYTFRRWLAECLHAVAHRPADERIVFINAWNEWAEGAILEPTDRFGRTYLQAVRDVARS
ncbi:glycoside hydrolase family 99-like domain-containing protein [Occultella gossypii]|uniref:Glycoside hydrolase family 99-like domain-containing protein n=1 Tax=Occultella gossypii TaxID=2800820 RepID=A0ABS7S7T3_9MICO|nr:glycoside hydrolase family 99-like domain-containing protein [Occultella gossypii]MBZ2196416.1 glycoside hydrolase family 99-like domain-containing protein [Occultella gossypii]